jgi:hypothetical protein
MKGKERKRKEKKRKAENKQRKRILLLEGRVKVERENNLKINNE